MIERTNVERVIAHLYPEIGLGSVFSSRVVHSRALTREMVLLSSRFTDGILPNSATFTKQTRKEHLQVMIDQANNLEPIADRLGIAMSGLALAPKIMTEIDEILNASRGRLGL